MICCCCCFNAFFFLEVLLLPRISIVINVTDNHSKFVTSILNSWYHAIIDLLIPCLSEWHLFKQQYLHVKNLEVILLSKSLFHSFKISYNFYFLICHFSHLSLSYHMTLDQAMSFLLSGKKQPQNGFPFFHFFHAAFYYPLHKNIISKRKYDDISFIKPH